MSLAHIFLSWIRPNALYIIAVIACLALAFKFYSNAFSRSVFVSLTKRRLTQVLRPAESHSSATTPAIPTDIPYAKNQKTL